MTTSIETSIKKLRILYKKYRDLTAPYSCGNKLAEYINPEIKKVKDEFNQIAENLRKLDPNCPQELKL